MIPLTSSHPQRCKNDVGETIPAWSAVRISGAESDANKLLTIKVKKPDGHITDGLFVNGAKDIASTGYGWLRPTSGVMPFWVKYSGTAPSADDEVGPQSGIYTFNTSGAGYIVIDVNTDKSIICVIRHIITLRYFELTATMSAAIDFKTSEETAAAKYLKHDSNGDLTDGDAFTATNRSESMDGVSGDQGIVAYMANGEKHPIAKDC